MEACRAWVMSGLWKEDGRSGRGEQNEISRLRSYEKERTTPILLLRAATPEKWIESGPVGEYVKLSATTTAAGSSYVRDACSERRLKTSNEGNNAKTACLEHGDTFDNPSDSILGSDVA